MPRTDLPLSVVRLEDRHAPAAFTVTTTVDNGDNANPTAGSLRQAILQANAAAGDDTITFAITGAGVRTITPPVALPTVTEKVTIDGTTQAGFNGTPVIRLSGSAAGAGANGLRLDTHSGSVVRGLTIGGFAAAGIFVKGGGGHVIAGDFLGTSQNGTAADGNGVGVQVSGASSVRVGGTDPADRNVIGGNKADGVQVIDAAVSTFVLGNFVGLDLNGTSPVANAGSGVAVFGGAGGTTVGGAAAGAGNVVSGNTGSGVRVAGAATAGTVVEGNRIGLSFAGQPLANGGDGVRVEGAAGTAPAGGTKLPDTNTFVRGNTISGNTGAGVAVRDTSRFVRIESNGISANGGEGIVVDATAQDQLGRPLLLAAKLDTGSVRRVAGTLTGRPTTEYRVDLFGNAVADPSGFGEGQTKIGTATVTTDGSGTVTFSVTAPADSFGGLFTASATATGAGDTSAFSNAVAIDRAPLTGNVVAVGIGAAGSAVNLYGPDGTFSRTLSSFDEANLQNIPGGVRTATADFTGDGIPEVVVGTGPGVATRVRVINPQTGTQVFAVDPFEAAFTGGVYVAAGDLNGDGTPDLVITPDEGGGPRVDVYTGKGFTKAASFFGIDDKNFRGGARAAVGDVNGDGARDLIVAAGFGGGPRVAGFDGRSVFAGSPARLFGDFFAFEQSLRNGVFVAVGDTDGDGKAELIAGGGPGGGPRVLVLGGAALLNNQLDPKANFFAGDQANRGGVRLAARDLTGDGRAEVVTGDGPDGANRVRVYNGTNFGATPADFAAFPGSIGGVYVG